MPKTRPPYPPEFKREALELLRISGKPLPQIAKDLGVSDQTLRNWRRQAEVDAGKAEGLTTDERAELRELRRRVRTLEMEKEVPAGQGCSYLRDAAGPERDGYQPPRPNELRTRLFGWRPFERFLSWNPTAP
jgi:transposase